MKSPLKAVTTTATKTVTVALAAAALAAGLAAAQAAGIGAAEIRGAEIRPVAGRSLDLGPLSGVAYYTAEPDGYRVVVTLAPRGAAPALRMEATLAAGQSVTLSTPRMPGEPAEAVEIARTGERVSVTARRLGAPVREADATH